MGESTTAHDVDAAQKQHHRGKTLARQAWQDDFVQARLVLLWHSLAESMLTSVLGMRERLT